MFEVKIFFFVGWCFALNVLVSDKLKKSVVDNAVDFFKGEGDYVDVVSLDVGDFVFGDCVVFSFYHLADFVRAVKNRSVFNRAEIQSWDFKYHFVVVVSTLRERRVYFNKLVYSGWKGGYFDGDHFIGAVAGLNTFTRVICVDYEDLAFRFMRIHAGKCLSIEYSL